jgi:hypothetical protein
MNTSDVRILRELGRRAADAAAEEHNARTVALWKGLNGLKPERPMVMLDQLPWNELNDTGELTPCCKDPFLRSLEGQLRQRLYRFRRFRADMVMPAFVPVARAVNVVTGLRVRERTLATDTANSVVSHRYEDQIPDDAALERIPMPRVSVDEALDRRHLAVAAEVFDGILPVRLVGPAWWGSLHAGPWDEITQLRGADPVLYDLADRPAFSMRMIEKFVRMRTAIAEQYESLGLFDADTPLVHCTGAFSDELPASGYDGQRARLRDVWVFGLAQVFSTVSPEMHDEFEIQPMRPLLERFGLVYYGCCDPLDRKISIVSRIRNVRKISVSPWADPERAASQIGRQYVFSAKPNPSHLATDRFDEDLVRAELRHIVATCQRHGTPCELILKDVSTVKYQPRRLEAWARIAMDVSRNGA